MGKLVVLGSRFNALASASSFCFNVIFISFGTISNSISCSSEYPRTASISTKRPDLHEMYLSEKSTRIGDYTHGIVYADNNLI